MAINPLKIFLFLLGGGAAAAATAYVSGVLDPYLAPSDAPPSQVATLPGSSDPAAPKSERLPAAEQPEAKPAEQSAGQAVEPAAIAAVVPTFDVVRVEPDGSVVIAGSAAPNALVEVLAQDEVLAASKADGGGAFAIVFDNPLKPGDYQLSLRATGSTNDVVLSIETAVISIPETPSGEVLAMVEEPGKPAEIITAPTKPAAAETAPAAEAQKPAAAEGAPAAEEQKPAATEEAPAAEEQKPATTAEAAPAAPGTADAGNSTQPAAEQPAAAETSPAAETQVAAADPAPEKPAPAVVTAPAPSIAVDAVEIEGRKVFVAGTAEAGRTVRVYANADVLGETKAAPNRRFLVEAERDLAVGDYLIRADVIGADGQVIARAVVPFEREPGESIAAVAPPAGEGRPAEVAASETQPGATEAAPAAGPSKPQEPATVAAEPAGEGKVEQPKQETEVAAASPAEATAPKLQASQAAVIIRRGDSLWRISRRVYGRGIRYSTIYLANQDQISDPNRIWPGQIFSVPETTPEGEAADLEAIGDQATTKTQ